MTTEDRQIQVLMVDDYPLLREGVRAALYERAHVIFADHTAHVEQLCRELSPDVLLFSSRPYESLAIEQIAVLHRTFPTLKILLMVADEQLAQARLALPLGVHGLLVKSDPLPLLNQAIHLILEGAQWLSPSARSVPVGKALPLTPLSSRERQLLDLIARGWDNPAIGAQLGLKEQTVRNYASQIYQKLNVTSRADAVLWAREHGFGRAAMSDER